MEYKSYRIIDGKPKWVIVNENGKIVNRNPNKEKIEIYYFLAFNKDRTKLEHGWRLPGKIVGYDYLSNL